MLFSPLSIKQRKLKIGPTNRRAIPCLEAMSYLHKQWKQTSESKKFNELATVFSALSSLHGIIQHLQGTSTRKLLFSEKFNHKRKHSHFCGRSRVRAPDLDRGQTREICEKKNENLPRDV